MALKRQEIPYVKNNINLLKTIWINSRFGILELHNRVTQNDVTLRVTNSKTFIEILLSSY